MCTYLAHSQLVFQIAGLGWSFVVIFVHVDPEAGAKTMEILADKAPRQRQDDQTI